MKKNIVLSMCASLLFLASCDYNEKNFPGFDELTDPKDVQTITMDLADADYKTIAGLTANKELALSKDPEGQTFVSALEAMGKNKYFTEDAQAVWYLPAFINDKNPYLSDGSKVTINYNNFEDLPEYLKDFNSISAYDLSAADYKKVWGEEISVSFLSPSTVKQIPTLLKGAVSKPADGAMRQVNYAYSETEPSLGGGGDLPDPEPTYTKIADVIKGGAGDYTIKGEVVAANTRSFLVNDETGIIMVYQNMLSTYSLGDVVTVSGTTSSYNGAPFQFSKDAKVAVVDRKTTFAYPTTPKNMTASDMDAYLDDAQLEYITYEGTLAISGNYFNVNIEGTTKAIGSIQYPITLSVDSKWNNKKIKVTGYAVGASSGKYVNTLATSIVLADGSETTTTLPVGLIALSAAGTYTTRGVISAIYTRGFMLTDGTGNILVYENKQPTSEVGDIVSVSGTTSKRNGLMQFGNVGLTITPENGTFSAVSGLVPQVMTGTDLEDYLLTPRVVYVSYEGVLTITDSGKGYNNYNMTVDGTTTAQVAFSYVDDTKIPVSLNGQKVIVKGYLLEAAGTKINTMVTSVEAATPAALRALAVTRAAAPQPTKSVVYRYDAAADAWKEYKATGAAVAVLQPADYNTMGATYVSKPDETLPVYLQQTRPYAKKDDKVGVVYYKDSNKTIVIDEFAFDGATWTKTTVSTPSVIVFLKSQGTWVEAKVYYASSFLNNDDGGFTIQDVNLGDLKKVWSMDAKFGWKASAFSGGNKESESWIVSPEIDLKKSAAPVLKFDVAINFLNGEDRAKHFGVLVSTNYVDDVTTADWTELTVENWPEGTSWDFTTITPVDLSAYKDQTIRIAFRYKSDLKAATTAEVKNMSVQE